MGPMGPMGPWARAWARARARALTRARARGGESSLGVQTPIPTHPGISNLRKGNPHFDFKNSSDKECGYKKKHAIMLKMHAIIKKQ